MTFPIISLLMPLLFGAGFAMVYVPLAMFIRSRLQEAKDASRANAEEKDAAISQEDARELLLQLRLVTSNVGRDVSAHSETIEAISQGIKGDEVLTTDEVLAATKRIVQANATLKSQLEEAKATIDEQAALIGSQLADALTDALTGIPNRRAFDQELKRRLAEYGRERRPFCLAMCDVDRFKRLNDKYGHVAGDEALKEIANRVVSAVREMDLPARYGGEEFGLVLPNTGLQDATVVVERIRKAICEKPIKWEDEYLEVTASFGLTESVDGDVTEASMIKRADEALYTSKRAGRNCSHTHDGAASELIEISSIRVPIDEPGSQAPNHEDSAQLASGLCGGQAEELDEPGSVNAARLVPRESFDEEVAKRVMQFRRDSGELSAILVEVEDYDRVAAESQALNLPVLDALAQLIIAAVGTSGLATKYSDRQFAALLYDTDIDGAVRLANRLQRAVNSCDFLNGPNARVIVDVSTGVTAAEADDFAECLHGRLVLAVREASQAGGRCVHIHHEGSMFPAELAPSRGG